VRLGILPGGGDCPGLNAVIRAVVRTAEGVHGDSLIGYRHGWQGVAERDSVELTGASTHAILAAGGTISEPRAITLASTRAPPSVLWIRSIGITSPRCSSLAGTGRSRRHA
jgi:6-phosphofructokinase